jgi:hypothetical protein
MNYLIQSRVFFGINAPVFAWMAAGVLLLFAVSAIVTLFFKVRRLRISGNRLSSSLATIQKSTFGNGRSLSDIEAIRKHFDDHRSFARSWAQLEHKLIRRRGTSGDEYWLSVPAADILQTAAVTDAQVNREWYEAIPGLLTGTGLLVTFIAILATPHRETTVSLYACVRSVSTPHSRFSNS